MSDASATLDLVDPAPAPDPATAPLGDSAPASVAVAEPAPATPTAVPPAEAAKPAEPVPNAPEKYEFTAPEGTQFDSDVLNAFEGAARKLDLAQDKAQMLIDEVGPVMAKRQAAAFEAVKAEWAQASRGDEEFGGDAFDANLAIAKAGLEATFSPKFREYLEATGLGSHPEMIRGLYRIGKTLQQDPSLRGRAGAGAPQSQAQRMFPDMK